MIEGYYMIIEFGDSFDFDRIDTKKLSPLLLHIFLIYFRAPTLTNNLIYQKEFQDYFHLMIDY